jgi:phage gpG-like protein
MVMTVKRTKNKANEAFLKTLIGRPFEINVGIMSDPQGTSTKSTDKKKPSHSERGMKRKPRGQNARKQTVAEVGAYHEFGTRNIPKRSFLVSTYKRKRREWTEYFIKLVQNASDEQAYRQALLKYGALMQRDVRLTFTNNNWKPLKHRSGTPLVDTGQLRRAIGYSVKEIK